MDIRKSNQRVFIDFVFMSIIAFVIMVFSCLSVIFNNNTNNYIDFSKNWVDEEGKIVDVFQIEDNSTIYHNIEDLTEDSTLFITIKNGIATIKIDDEIIYETNQKYKEYYGKGKGIYYIDVIIPEEAKDKTLSISIDNPYNEITPITSMYLGDSGDILNSNLKKFSIRASLSFTIVIIGLVLCFLFVPMYKKKIVGSEFLYIGLFSVNIGMFMLNDSGILQLMYGNAEKFHMLAELFMMLMIIPAMLYADKVYNKTKSKIPLYICMLSALLFVVTFLLNFLQIFDYHQTVFLFHINCLIAMLYMGGCLIDNLIRRTRIIKLMGILFVCLGGLLDIVLFYLKINLCSSLFTLIGVIIFLLVEITQVIYDQLSKFQIEFKNEMFRRLAYHDGLTDLLNRTSFNEKMAELEEYKENVIIAMFDVNNLKTTNDTLGHRLGDQLILISSAALTKYLGTLGNIYRIGGDEFVLIMEDKQREEELKDSIDKLVNYLDSEEYDFPGKISIAYGYSKYRSKKHTDLNDTLNEADEKMYLKKSKMKKNMK